jgi:DMSO/TMAO reductase YedYZ molybdopterin-dependent catalytic subunit
VSWNSASIRDDLPPGQHRLHELPRFGPRAFTAASVAVPTDFRLRIDGAVSAPLELTLADLQTLPEVKQTSDMHCVATWSAVGIRWGGRRFVDVWRDLLVPRSEPDPGVLFIRATGLDGYRTNILLSEALRDDVLLADQLGGEQLPLAHGAPLRFLLPQLYGYKSMKHLCRLELMTEFEPLETGRWVEHARARADLEERNGRRHQIFWRYVYRAQRPAMLALARRHARRFDLD